MPEVPYPAETPHSFLEGAEEYRKAVELLLMRPTETPIEPLGLLAAHCAELLLKALLLASGEPLGTLRSPELRHSLTALWQLALERNLPLEDPVPFWCDALALAHDAPFMYRYPRPGWGVIVPEPQELREGLNGLFSAARSVMSVSGHDVI
jgi:hypothetical protein